MNATRFGNDAGVQFGINDALSWDVRTWSTALRFWEERGGLNRPKQRCLEIGANAGGLSVWLARQGHDVVCSDLEGTEANARPLAARWDVEDRITFEDIDATAIPYDNAFDIVVFKSVLGGVGHDGAIDRQRTAIASMYRALRPGGRLLFAENLTGSALHRWLRERYIAWGTRWRYVTIEEMQYFLSDFRRVDFGTAGFFGTLGRTERQRDLLASVDRLVTNAVLPPDWRYMIYGVAEK